MLAALPQLSLAPMDGWLPRPARMDRFASGMLGPESHEVRSGKTMPSGRQLPLARMVCGSPRVIIIRTRSRSGRCKGATECSSLATQVLVERGDAPSHRTVGDSLPLAAQGCACGTLIGVAIR